ncbi:HAD family hydrolase [Deinococcus cavernae]|uniref:HAD family hydrolase n=1 Tax=Deinococcus cavernae TaxID=2320857 RepID=A0A418VHY0_9DEIO|nr:HAD-IA family hydrolase [Deinococcus cavernae]RJF75702.1 HAD family hydrolase [Deinococcus cavernae]
MIQPVNTLFPENRTAQELEAFRQAVPANAVLTVFKNFAPGLDKQIPHSDSDESLAVVFRFPGLPDAIAGSIRGMQSYHNWLYYRIEADGRKGGYHYSRYQPATFVEDYVEVLEEALGRKIKVEYSDTVLENLQWAVTPTQEQHGRYHIFGGLHDSVKAVVFDLDNTLADTRQLEPFRRNQDRQGLETALCSTQPYVHEDLRRVLRETSDVVPIAIVTVSPRWYAERLLNTLFPDIEWNAIVTYGDVDRPKPFPDGLRLAAEKLNVNPEDVLVVGDSRDDVEAAYHAGMQVALATWHVTDPEAIRFIPDAVMEAPEGVLVYLTSPTLCLPYLEAWLTDEDWEALDYLDPYPAFTDVPGQPALPVSVLGRYFPNYDQTLDLHSKLGLGQFCVGVVKPSA